MFTKSGLTLAVALGIVVLTSGVADAQIVTVKPNYNAAIPPNMPNPTAAPSGTYSVPMGNPPPAYKILIDYGTIANGTFTLMPNGPGEATVALNPGMGGGPYVWQQGHTTALVNPPPALYVRARLQSWVKAQNRWFTEDTAYATCP